LYNLEDIKLRVNQNKKARIKQMEMAYQIIDEEVEKFCLKSDRIISKKRI
jgi:glutamyl-tRNA reductase